MKIYYYPKCSTCVKALKWLEKQGIEVEKIHIVDERPSKEVLEEAWKKSGLPLKKLFNTSGLVYKELGLKDKLAGMSEDEQLALLATNGKLIKRPLLIAEEFTLVGFKENEWLERLY